MIGVQIILVTVNTDYPLVLLAGSSNNAVTNVASSMEYDVAAVVHLQSDCLTDSGIREAVGILNVNIDLLAQLLGSIGNWSMVGLF